MQFTDRAPLYSLSRITGPTHNWLGLVIAPGPTNAEPEIEMLQLAVPAENALDRHEVAAQVMLGVAQACAELERAYYIEKIQYVDSDTGPVETYRQLATHLIRRIDAKLHGDEPA